MPSTPKNTKCSHLGCTNTKSPYNSYCMTHGGRNTYADTKERRDSNAMYQTKQWRSMRKIQLSKHPLCLACLSNGRITPAWHIDHVFPWHLISKEAFYVNLFQSLCHNCHSHKTGLERKGIYRHYTIPNKDYAVDDYAYVIRTKVAGGG